MGIKNRKEKAIFNKHQKPLTNKNSLPLNKDILQSKEIANDKAIKLSKEFIAYREKNKSNSVKFDNQTNCIKSKHLNIQTSNKDFNDDVSNNNLALAINNIENKKNHLVNKYKSKQLNTTEDIGKPNPIIQNNNSMELESLKNKVVIGNSIKTAKYSSLDLNHSSNGIDIENQPMDELNQNKLPLNSYLIKLRKEDLIKNIKVEDSKLIKGKIIASDFSKETIVDKVDEGLETNDIGMKSISSTSQNLSDSKFVVNKIKSRSKNRIINRNTRAFSKSKIRTQSKSSTNINDNPHVEAKIKEKVINDTYNKEVKKTFIEAKIEIIKNRLVKVVDLEISKALPIFFIALFLMTSVLAVGNGNISTSTSFVILTTDEQNQAYLDYYQELKADLKDEIDYLAANNNHDYVVIDGLDSSGNLYDLDFTEWISILAVKIEQSFKLSNYEYSYLKEVFDNMIYYETHVEVDTSTDSEGDTTTTTTLVITVINKYYEQIKDDLGFTPDDLEWVERLIEYDSLSERIENIPSNSHFISGGGNLTTEEIEKYGGEMVHPLNGLGYISSPYGYRIHPIDGIKKFHSGLDLAVVSGTPIYSAQDGKVIHSGSMGGYGLTVMIQHDNGVVTLYAHCSSLVAQVGQYISKGDHISNVGSTGKSTGPHLHFEVRANGSTVNPLSFINH